MSDRGRSVVIIGDLLTDVVAQLAGPLAPASDTRASVTVAAGGSAASTAAWLARSGVPVSFVARRGDDLAGREREAELVSWGVRPLLAVDPSRGTGAVVVLVAVDGERTMVTDRGASGLLSPADLPPFAGFAHLHLSGYVLLSESSRPAGLAALAAARAEGLTVSIGASSSEPLRLSGPTRFLADTAGAELLIANADEAVVLGPVPALVERYAAVAVTHGAAGSSWRSVAGFWSVPAEPVRVVDTTGAGDAFAAGLLSAWLGGAGPEKALGAGALLAAEALGSVGSRPTVVVRADRSAAAG